VTHSAANAGLVAFVRLAPFGLFSLAAGVAADRRGAPSLSELEIAEPSSK
jgi:hypothetical protein